MAVESRASFRIALSILIAFHVAAIFIVGIPLSFPGKRTVVSAIRPYMVIVGLWQKWSMFAPLPESTNYAFWSDVRLRDGSLCRWDFPRMDRLSLGARYEKERYRKWEEDYLRLDEYSFLWPDAARFAARQCVIDRRNPPVEVFLIRAGREIPPPDSLRHGVGKEMFFHYQVSPEDLE